MPGPFSFGARTTRRSIHPRLPHPGPGSSESQPVRKNFRSGGNLSDDDAETQSLGLELTVEEVVGGRIRFEDPRDDRPPSLQETLVGGMAGVEPKIKKTLPLSGIGPEHPPIFEPSFVLVEQPPHTMDCRRERCPGQGSNREEAVKSAPAPWPKRHGLGRGAHRGGASGREDRQLTARSAPAVRSVPTRPDRASWLGARRVGCDQSARGGMRRSTPPKNSGFLGSVLSGERSEMTFPTGSEGPTPDEPKRCPAVHHGEAIA